MQVITYEAIVENGQVKLSNSVQLPEKAKVYVMVPSTPAQPRFLVAGPRLARPEQAPNFVKEVIEETPDANV